MIGGWRHKNNNKAARGKRRTYKQTNYKKKNHKKTLRKFRRKRR